MCALLCVMLSMIKDLEWWLRCRQLRVEARESADRLVDILEKMKNEKNEKEKNVRK